MREWKGLAWDVTCEDTFASSHVHMANTEAGAVAMEAEHWKMQQYEDLSINHMPLHPSAVETAGSFGPEARGSLKELVDSFA